MKLREEGEGKKLQDKIITALKKIDQPYQNWDAFEMRVKSSKPFNLSAAFIKNIIMAYLSMMRRQIM